VTDFGKYAAIVLGVLIVLGGVCWFLWHTAYQRGVSDTVAAPAETTVVYYPKPVVMYMPSIDIGHIKPTVYDVPMPTGEVWTVAHIDSTVAKVRVVADYYSPVALSPRGYFALSIHQIAPDTVLVPVPGKEIIRYVEVVKGASWQTYGLCILGGGVAFLVGENLISHIK
jgi:hypothetical protein